MGSANYLKTLLLSVVNKDFMQRLEQYPAIGKDDFPYLFIFYIGGV